MTSYYLNRWFDRWKKCHWFEPGLIKPKVLQPQPFLSKYSGPNSPVFGRRKINDPQSWIFNSLTAPPPRVCCITARLRLRESNFRFFSESETMFYTQHHTASDFTFTTCHTDHTTSWFRCSQHLVKINLKLNHHLQLVSVALTAPRKKTHCLIYSKMTFTTNSSRVQTLKLVHTKHERPCSEFTTVTPLRRSRHPPNSCQVSAEACDVNSIRVTKKSEHVWELQDAEAKQTTEITSSAHQRFRTCSPQTSSHIPPPPSSHVHPLINHDASPSC